MAFKAWYRSVYTYTSDRQIIDELKWQTNAVRDRHVPLLSSSSEQGEQFKSFIGSLHHRLENYQLHSGKGAEKKRITLKNVYLKRNQGIALQSGTKFGMSYRVEPNTARNPMPVTCMVTNRSGATVFCLAQQNYDLSALENDPSFISGLNANQQGYLKALYKSVNPLLVVGLTSRGQRPIKAGTYQFTCGPEELFAGVCEVIYLMRNSLFQGELVPTHDAIECYEPAYHIVRSFIKSIS